MTATTRDTTVEMMAVGDHAVAELAEPVELTPPLTDRLVELARELTSTPRRAAAVTAWFVCAVAALVALVPSPVSVRTRLGPARARCGLDTFVYSYPDRAVRDSCRHAEAGHLAVFIPAAVVLSAGLMAAAVIVLRRNGRAARLAASPARLALVAVGAVAALVGLLALRPAVVELNQGGAVTTARCGADSYFFGYPDGAVKAACHRAYAPHAWVLFLATVVVAVTAVALVVLGGRLRSTTSWAGPVAAVALIVGAFLLVPSTVQVAGGTTPATASCGIDTILAGHPDRAVEHACRSRDTGRVVIALAALAAAGGAAAFALRRRRSSEGVAA